MMISRDVRAVLLRWVWWLVRTIAATAVATYAVRIMIIPFLIEPVLGITSYGMYSKLLYGGIAFFFGAFIVFSLVRVLLVEEVGASGSLKLNGWIATSMCLTSVGVFATRRGTESTSSMLALALLLFSAIILFFIIGAADRQGAPIGGASWRVRSK